MIRAASFLRQSQLMNPLRPLPLLALIGGVLLGCLLFLGVHRWVPVPLNELTSGPFSVVGFAWRSRAKSRQRSMSGIARRAMPDDLVSQ